MRIENDLCILLALFRHKKVAQVLSARFTVRILMLYTYLSEVFCNTLEKNEADPLHDLDASLQVKTPPR